MFEPLLVRDASVGPPFSDSDHNTVHYTIQMPVAEDENVSSDSNIEVLFMGAS